MILLYLYVPAYHNPIMILVLLIIKWIKIIPFQSMCCCDAHLRIDILVKIKVFCFYFNLNSSPNLHFFSFSCKCQFCHLIFQRNVVRILLPPLYHFKSNKQTILSLTSKIRSHEWWLRDRRFWAQRKNIPCKSEQLRNKEWELKGNIKSKRGE